MTFDVDPSVWKTVPFKQFSQNGCLISEPVRVQNVGAVEIILSKSGCTAGQVLEVIGETGSFLQLEGGRTVPRSRINDQWKWARS